MFKVKIKYTRYFTSRNFSCEKKDKGCNCHWCIDYGFGYTGCADYEDEDAKGQCCWLDSEEIYKAFSCKSIDYNAQTHGDMRLNGTGMFTCDKLEIPYEDISYLEIDGKVIIDEEEE